MGRELNPSIGSFDVKYFNELRPGLILWTLINISMACEQATRRGGLTQITDSMWLVLAFQAWYVGDALFNEVRCMNHSSVATLLTPIPLIARHFDDHGHHHRRLWLYALNR